MRSIPLLAVDTTDVFDEIAAAKHEPRRGRMQAARGEVLAAYQGYEGVARFQIPRRQSRRQGVRNHAMDGTQQAVHRKMEACISPRLLQRRRLYLLPCRPRRGFPSGCP